MLNVLTSVGQWEREATGERTAEALSHLRSQGVRLGGAALGWKRSGDLDCEGRRIVEDVEAEVATVNRIHALRAAGLTLRQIAASLTAEGVPTKRGGAWSHKVVRSVLLRAA